VNDVAMADRKFLSEFAVNLFSARWMITPASELASDGVMAGEAADVSKECHIYLICRRPASAFDPAHHVYEGNHLSGNIVYRRAGVPSAVPFTMPFELVDGATQLRVSNYPHREVQTLNEAGEEIRRVPAHSLSLIGIVNDPALKTLEVLYVGQAFGDGRRTAIERLRNHATLQKILAQMHHEMPDDEVILLTFEYVPYRVISMFDGVDKKAIRDERDTERFSSILDNPLTEHQQVCLAEAGLIRYFQPKYNEIYKASFPASDQRILDQCYQLDFSALIVEIDTEELDISLYSPAVGAAQHHIAQFDLIDPRFRRSFFAFVDKDGKTFEMPEVIPPSR
jgi:hypothetical protein